MHFIQGTISACQNENVYLFRYFYVAQLLYHVNNFNKYRIQGYCDRRISVLNLGCLYSLHIFVNRWLGGDGVKS